MPARQARGASAGEPGTFDEVLDRCVQVLRNWDLAVVRSVFHPPNATFFFLEPIDILHYQVKARRVLTARDAAGGKKTPKPQSGDVEMDVLQVRKVEGQRNYRMFTFGFRRIEGTWKIYSVAPGGCD